MLPDKIVDDLFGGFVRYLSKRKVLLLIVSLILFSPENSQVLNIEVWKSGVNESKDLAISFFGGIKLYQYIFLVLMIFFISPASSSWFFKKIFMLVVRVSWKVFLTRQIAVINKMEGDRLNEGEMAAFQTSCKQAMDRINNISIFYADCNSMLLIASFYLVVNHISFVIYVILFLVFSMCYLGIFLARKAVWLYLDEIWPLCVIVEEVEHYKKIEGLKDIV